MNGKGGEISGFMGWVLSGTVDSEGNGFGDGTSCWKWA